MSCKFLNAKRLTRHDKLAQVIARVARLSGVAVQMEPRVDGRDRSRAMATYFFMYNQPSSTP